MSIQSQLDQVLALLHKATKGELIYRHGENVQIKHPNGETYNFARLHCTIGKSEREWENGDAIAASINFLREHGPAISAAVGGEGEEMAWVIKNTTVGPDEPAHELDYICSEIDKLPVGTRLYASATVDVGANDFLDGMIAALGCLWLGFGYGPGTAEYDEVLNSAGRAKVLERAKTMHPEDIANAGLAALIGEKA